MKFILLIQILYALLFFVFCFWLLISFFFSICIFLELWFVLFNMLEYISSNNLISVFKIVFQYISTYCNVICKSHFQLSKKSYCY
jgi:hypothetical protein